MSLIPKNIGPFPPCRVSGLARDMEEYLRDVAVYTEKHLRQHDINLGPAGLNPGHIHQWGEEYMLHAETHEVFGTDLISHDALTDFVAKEHINHAGVSVIAGTNLNGGGAITANRTLNLSDTPSVTSLTADTLTGTTIASESLLTVGTLSLAAGSITDSGGTIDFDNENLSTTGIFDVGLVRAIGVEATTVLQTSGTLYFYDGGIRSLMYLDDNNLIIENTVSGKNIQLSTSSGALLVDQIGVVDDTNVLQLGENALTVNGVLVAGAITGTSLISSGGLTVDTDTLVVDAVNHRVGIGTATPGSPLHVAKEMSDHTPLVLLENLGTNSGEGDVLDVYTRRADGFTDGYIAQFRNVVGTKVYIRGDGNVGIGTTEPTSKLHIFSPDAADSWNQAHIALVTISNLDMNADQSEALLVRGGANNALTQVFEVQDYSGNADFTVWGDGEITMNGNVGINVTDPDAKLEVVGTLHISDAATFDGTLGAGAITGTSFITGGDIGVAGDTDLLQLAANALTVNGDVTATGIVQAEHLYSTDDAYIVDKLGVGRTPVYYALEMEGADTGAWIKRVTDNIGTGRAPFFWFWRAQGTVSTPTAVAANSQLGKIQFSGLDVAGSGFGELACSIECWVDGVVAEGDVPGKLEFRTATGGTNTLRMTIKSGGKVGINDAVPASQLDVTGDINTTENYKVDDVQVVGNQQDHLADADAAVAAAAGDPPTQVEFNALVTAYNDLAAKFNTLLDRLDADAGHGLLAGAS